MDRLRYILVGLTLCCGAATFIWQTLFYLRLRRHHAEAWQALGRPGVLGGSLDSGRRVIGFLWRQEYRSFSDTRSVRVARWYRGCMAAFAVLLVCTLVVFIINVWMRR